MPRCSSLRSGRRGRRGRFRERGAALPSAPNLGLSALDGAPVKTVDNVTRGVDKTTPDATEVAPAAGKTVKKAVPVVKELPTDSSARAARRRSCRSRACPSADPVRRRRPRRDRRGPGPLPRALRHVRSGVRVRRVPGCGQAVRRVTAARTRSSVAVRATRTKRSPAGP
ncbi:hypothetical protein ACFQV4_33950 [Streptomyces thermocarboxydus]